MGAHKIPKFFRNRLAEIAANTGLPYNRVRKAILNLDDYQTLEIATNYILKVEALRIKSAEEGYSAAEKTASHYLRICKAKEQ